VLHIITHEEVLGFKIARVHRPIIGYLRHFYAFIKTGIKNIRPGNQRSEKIWENVTHFYIRRLSYLRRNVIKFKSKLLLNLISEMKRFEIEIKGVSILRI